MKSGIEAFIPKFPHLVQECVNIGDIGRLQEIELNTREMICNGLDPVVGEQYLRRVRDAKKLVLEEFLQTNLPVKNTKDN